MNTSTFFRWLKFHKIEMQILDDNAGSKAVRRVVAVTNASKLHNMWERTDNSKFMVKDTLSDEAEEYRAALDEILEDDIYTLIVDDVCFTDVKSPTIISFSKNVLLTVLEDFYMYLDEIYITDASLDWFLAINHRLELFLYGDGSNKKCGAMQHIISEQKRRKKAELTADSVG